LPLAPNATSIAAVTGAQPWTSMRELTALPDPLARYEGTQEGKKGYGRE